MEIIWLWFIVEQMHISSTKNYMLGQWYNVNPLNYSIYLRWPYYMRIVIKRKTSEMCFRWSGLTSVILQKEIKDQYTKWKLSYSLSCSSKPVWLSLFCVSFEELCLFVFTLIPWQDILTKKTFSHSRWHIPQGASALHRAHMQMYTWTFESNQLSVR